MAHIVHLHTPGRIIFDKGVCMVKQVNKMSKAELDKSRELSAKKAAKTRKEAAAKRDLDQRVQEIVKQYLPYATSIASRVAKSISSSVDFDDLLCNARVGLLEAAKRYDASQQVDFKTFAYYRIKGAIYDGLRKSGWVPRTLYSKIKFEEAANDYLRQQSETGGEVVWQGDDEERIYDIVNNIASIYVMSIDANEDFDIEDPSHENIETKAEFHQVRNYMRKAINSLPYKEKQLVKMYYFQNKTLEEAGERLGLSKSWTSRLHVRALDLLMKRIKMLATQSDDAGDLDEVLIAQER